MRYMQTYAAYGEFRYFTMLFVTTTDERVESIRRGMSDLPSEFANHYRFTTFNEAMTDFLSSIWKSRAPEDSKLYALIRET